MTDPAALPGGPELPTPVTLARLERALSADGWTSDAEAGRLVRRWPHLEMTLSLRRNDGELLLFQGRPVGEPTPISQAGAADEFITGWHRDRIWPVLVMTSSENALMVQTHLGVDVTAGLTAAQLGDALRVGIGTTHQCFAALGERGLAPRAPAPEDPGGPGSSADPEAG